VRKKHGNSTAAGNITETAWKIYGINVELGNAMEIAWKL